MLSIGRGLLSLDPKQSTKRVALIASLAGIARYQATRLTV